MVIAYCRSCDEPVQMLVSPARGIRPECGSCARDRREWEALTPAQRDHERAAYAGEPRDGLEARLRRTPGY